MSNDSNWVRICRSCGHPHYGTKAFLIRERRTCEKCGDDLPPAVVYRTDSKPSGSSAHDVDAGTQAPNSHPTHTRRCQRCGKTVTGTLNEVVGYGDYCPSCGDFLDAPIPISPNARGGGAKKSDAGNDEKEAPSQRVMGGEYLLQWRDANVTEVLPREGGGGVFGRINAVHPSLATLRTLSRRQFAYRYVGDTLELTNLSQYGTLVNGKMLSSKEEVAQIDSYGIIEMAGQVFEVARDVK